MTTPSDPTPPSGEPAPPPLPPALPAPETLPAPIPQPKARRRFGWWRPLRALIAFLFVLFSAAVLVLGFGLYLAIAGHNLPLLRSAVALVGRAIDGQRTTALQARIELRPARSELRGDVTITVTADAAARQRFYFLLNQGLRLRDVWQSSDEATRIPVTTFRLGQILVVQLAQPLAPQATARIGIAYGGTVHPTAVGGTDTVLEAGDVVLAPTDLWYPSDVQGAFDADVEVQLPADLTLAHNGREQQRIVEGTTARVHFTSERPVAGLALIAGRYAERTREHDGHRYRVLLPPDSTLPAERLLESMGVAERGLAEHFGPSGFGGSTLVVPRRLGRAFNDGSGLLAIPPRYFSDGHHGYQTIAHELAHNWWGATVSERWLAPGTGGEWVVEGFAQYAGWRAVGERFGEAAFVHTLQQNFFDPDVTGVLADASVLDNGLDPNARATIYQKGGYVTYLLAQQLGDGFDAAARALLEKYRYRAADDAAVQAVFAATSQQDLTAFFNTWVRSRASIDLSLEPQEGSAVVRNLRPAAPPDRVALWRGAAGAEMERTTTAVGETVPDVGAQRLLLDPLAATADMFRSNNVLPRADTPRRVAAAAHGELLVVDGEPQSWEPATVRVVDQAGKILHSWAIDGGIEGAPTWSADGSRIIAVESGRAGQPTLVALRLGDGGRQTLGHDRIAAADGDGTVVARGGRLLRLGSGRDRGQLLISHPDARIGSLLPAPNGGGIAYTLIRGTEMELRLLPPGASESRVLFSWAAASPSWTWAADASRLFVALPGEWDWQLWELPTDGSEPRRLVHEAARITSVAAAPDGTRVALVAQPDVDTPDDRTALFVFDLASSDLRHYDEPATTFIDAAWLDAATLAVITAPASDAGIPQARRLEKLTVSDGARAPL